MSNAAVIGQEGVGLGASLAGYNDYGQTNPGPQPQDIARQTGIVQSMLPPDLAKNPAFINAFTSQGLTDDQLTDTINGVMGHSQLSQIAQAINNVGDPTVRAGFWQRLTSDQQQGLQSLGMTPPTSATPPPPKHNSPWDMLIHSIGAVGGIIGEGWHDVYNDALKYPVHAANYVSAMPKHLYRTSVAMEDPSMSSPQGGTQPGWLQSLLHALPAAAGFGAGMAGGGPVGGGIGLSVASGLVTGAFGAANALGIPGFTGTPSIRKAWDETANGDKFFTQNVTSQAGKILQNDPTAVSFAKAVAQDGNLDNGVARFLAASNMDPSSPAGKQYAQQLYTWTQQHPEFQSAVSTLVNGKTSWGRDLADGFGATHGAPHTAISAAADATGSWFGDPLIIGGHLLKSWKIAQAIPTIAAADHIEEARSVVPRVQEMIQAGAAKGSALADTTAERRAALEALDYGREVRDPSLPGYQQALSSSAASAQQKSAMLVADHLRTGNIASLLAQMPRAEKGLQWLSEYANAQSGLGSALALDTEAAGHTTMDANAVFDAYKSGAGVTALASGKFGSFLSPAALELPKLTDRGMAMANLRIGALDTIDRLANARNGIGLDQPLDPADLTQSSQKFAGLKNLVVTPFSWGGQVANAALTGVPRAPTLLLDGEGAWGDMSRFLRLGMGRSAAADALDRIFAAPDVASRLPILQDYIKTMADQAGMNATEEGRNLVARYVDGIGQRYSSVIDDVLPGFDKSAAVLPSQLSEAIGIPQAEDWQNAAKRIGIRSMLYKTTNNALTDAYISNIWKPTSLMKLGFVPRVVMEELLPTIIRLGPKALAENNMFLPAMDAISKDAATGVWGPMHSLEYVGRFANYVAGGGEFAGPSDFMANYLGNLVTRGVAGIGRMVMDNPDSELEAYQKFNQARRSVKDLSSAAGELTDFYREAADDRTLTAEQYAKREAELKAQVADAYATVGGDPVVRRAFGSLFATRVNYGLGRLADPEISSLVDRNGDLITQMPMISQMEKVANDDPKAIAAHLYGYGMLSRDPMALEGMKAALGYVGPNTLDRVAAPMRTFARYDGMDDQAIFESLRQAAQDARPGYRRAMQKFAVTGDDAYLKLARNSLINTDQEMQLGELLDNAHELVANKGRAIQALLNKSDPFYDPGQADLAATRAMHDWLTSDDETAVRARTLGVRAKYANGQAVAEPVRPGFTSVYAPMASASDVEDLAKNRQWTLAAGIGRPGEVHPGSLSALASLDTASVPARAQVAREKGEAMLALGRWGSTDSEKARAVVDELSRELGMDVSVGRVDIPTPVSRMRSLAGPDYTVIPGVNAEAQLRQQAMEARLDMANYQGSGALHDQHTPDERLLGVEHLSQLRPETPGTTQDEALREWANTAWSHIKPQVIAQTGPNTDESLHEITVPMLQDRELKPYHLVGSLENLPSALAPKLVVNPPKGWWQNLVDHFFDGAVAPAIDSMARRPLFVHNYAKGVMAAAPLRQILGEPTDELARDMGYGNGRQLDDGIKMLDAEHKDAVEEAQQAAREGRAAPLGPVPYERPGGIEVRETKDLGIGKTLFGSAYTLPNGSQYIGIDPNAIRQAWAWSEMEPSVLDSYSGGESTWRHMNIDPARMRAWFEENGGVDAFQQHVIEHEHAHLGLAHTGGNSVANEVAAETIALRQQGVPTHLVTTDGSPITGASEPHPLNVATPEKLDEARRMVAAQDTIDDQIRAVALNRAVEDSTPYINDHSVRSQLSETLRNISPFYWAQESFLRRWGRTFEYTPEALAKAEEYMNGINHSGLVKTNQYGEKVFVYPGSSQLQKFLTSSAQVIFGDKATLPISVPLSGQVKFASPGFDRLGVPSVGPLVGVPMKFLASRFPELTGAEQGLLGSRGTGGGPLDALIPSTVTKLYHTIADNPNTSAHYASAMMQAAGMLMAEGHGPPDNATPDQLQAFQDRLNNWTRIMLLNRALFGFVGPAPAAENFKNLQPDFVKLLNETHDITAATKMFASEHPDATPWTVFATKTPSKAQLGTTQQALDWMNGNPQTVSAYPRAAAWLMPQSTQSDKFSRAAYYEQLANDMRQRRSPDDYVREVIYQRSADTYFQAVDKFHQAIAATPDAATRTQLTNEWNHQKAAYLAQHPVFDAMLTDPSGHQNRLAVLQEMRQALADPSTPTAPINDGLRWLMDQWDTYQLYRDQLKSNRTAAASGERQRLDVNMANLMHYVTVSRPELVPFYQRIIRPELALADKQLTEAAA